MTHNTKTMLTDEELMHKLSDLSIESVMLSHQPLMTVEDQNAQKHLSHGAHSKNLFLKDKANKFWMITALDDTSINLKNAAKQLGAVKFTFAKPAEMLELLGITPGSVSPFALINDTTNQVTFVLEKRMLDYSHQNFHPLRNDRTVRIGTEDFLAFTKHIDHAPILFDPGDDGIQTA
ncbi:MAG: prolyl-tRNA synthetase associated domain-containing protein [Cyanobacteria bacterium SZAS-4]|nr:prolyl-tRNA synthetase associated domain-containing protein [Cyanobacteria bacterium SZAS-4]